MKYQFISSRKYEVWEDTYFSVKASSYKKAVVKAIKCFDNEIINYDDVKLDTEYMEEIQDDNGKPTRILLGSNNEEIANNLERKCEHSDSFFSLYEPLKNVVNIDAAYYGYLYETHGRDIKIINEIPNKRIWTLIEEDGMTFVISGKHYVNRLGYFVCKNEWCDDNEEIFIFEKN